MNRRLVIEFDGASLALGSTASGIVVTPVSKFAWGRWPAEIVLSIRAGIAPSLSKAIARRLPISYRRGPADAKPTPEAGRM
jgi:hypothetical protein